MPKSFLSLSAVIHSKKLKTLPVQHDNIFLIISQIDFLVSLGPLKLCAREIEKIVFEI
jgi:hypothetical protein